MKYNPLFLFILTFRCVSTSLMHAAQQANTQGSMLPNTFHELVSFFQRRGYKLEIYDKFKHINKRDFTGTTVLHAAIAHKYVELVKHLLRRPDLDVNIPDDEGYTALDKALEIHATSGAETEDKDSLSILNLLSQTNAKMGYELLTPLSGMSLSSTPSPDILKMIDADAIEIYPKGDSDSSFDDIMNSRKSL
jgi:hypothetical protein